MSFSLTKVKRAKSLLLISVLDRVKSLSTRIFHKIIGFFNFVFELCPYFKSFLRMWSNQLKVKSVQSTLSHLQSPPE